jgi:hypothetical protein
MTPETITQSGVPSRLAVLGREWPSISLTAAYGRVETDAIQKAIHPTRKRTSKALRLHLLHASIATTIPTEKPFVR